jgi:hypothetical protein
MEVCYWALLFMPLVILHHFLNVFVQLANKRGFKQANKKYPIFMNSRDNIAAYRPVARQQSRNKQTYQSRY